jgi:hypothetical protein
MHNASKMYVCVVIFCGSRKGAKPNGCGMLRGILFKLKAALGNNRIAQSRF